MVRDIIIIESDFYRIIGGNIKRLAHQKGYSVAELTNYLDYKSRSTVPHYLRGERRIGVFDLYLLAALFDVPMERFFEFSLREVIND